MENILVGMFSGIFLYLSSYSWLSQEYRYKYECIVDSYGVFVDIAFGGLAVLASVGTGGTLLFAFGLAIGFSVIIRLMHSIYMTSAVIRYSISLFLLSAIATILLNFLN